MRVAFVAEGDANTADCWSGSGRSFVQALRRSGLDVDVYNAELSSWSRAVAAGLTYHPRRDRWRQRYILGGVPFAARSAAVGRALTKAGVLYEAIIQVGATFEVRKSSRLRAEYILYCDSNLAYARRGAPFSAASRLTMRELRPALTREQRIYDSATRIWTMSDALASSFVSDFAQPAGKMKTIYAGPNNIPSSSGTRKSGKRILFLGKDHLRKGSSILLEAFEKVRSSVPDAELHIVGGIPEGADRPGVVSYGVVSRSDADGARLLDQLFGTALLFCLPSRYEPFGIAFIEAMLAGLPCIGTTKWAMPEIIDNGNTGWLVADGSVDELASVLISALRDPAECARRGALARERALARFTWDRVAARALADLTAMRDAGTRVRVPAN